MVHSHSTYPTTPVRRRWLFRVMAIGVGLVVVGAVEFGLRLAGVERYYESAAPMVGFSNVRPLFRKSAAGDRMEIADYRQVFFQPDSFATDKPADGFRIFCLGGSTVQGRPYSIETAFTRWLELNLRAATPNRSWEVVNCGGVSYASYRLVPILEEVLKYEPNLLVVYTGHNEFLEERTYPAIKRQALWLRNLQEHVLQWRIAGVMRACLPDKATSAPIELPEEVDALLDYQGGLAEYHRDSAWRDGVIHEYEQNLSKMALVARQARVPLWFVNPVSNIRDTPPFKVELPQGWDAEQTIEFERQWQAAKESSWDDLPGKEALVNNVLELDSGHAEAWFLLAKIYDAQKRYGDARLAYLRAKDEDVCPLRMTEPMYASLERVARRFDCPLIDVRAMFESVASQGIPGDDELIDHVHPRIEGHQQIANQLFDVLVARGVVANAPGWEDRRKQIYQANYEALAHNYFPESVERLKGLQTWAAGRVTRLRLPKDE